MQVLLRECTARGHRWQDAKNYSEMWGPLHAAAVGGHEAVAVALLCAAGAAGAERLVVQVNKHGSTATHLAARRGSPSLLRVLLAAAPTPTALLSRRDGTGRTPMDVAAACKHTSALQLFQGLAEGGAVAAA